MRTGLSTSTFLTWLILAPAAGAQLAPLVVTDSTNDKFWLCAGGNIIRLGTRFNVLGASRYPEAGDLPVSVRGMVAPGDVRTYQVWYRNADASFCTGDTFNLSNGVTVTWTS